MRKLWKRIPKGRRLALECALLLFLLLAAWSVVDYASPCAGTAFRRALRDANYAPTGMELLVEGKIDIQDSVFCDTSALGTDAERIYRTELTKIHGWTASDVHSLPKAAEEVWIMPLAWYQIGWDSYMDKWEYENYQAAPVTDRSPCFAVKAPGASASMTLVLEQGEYFDYGEPFPSEAGRFPLVLLDAKDGWFVFGFDLEDLKQNLQYEYRINESRTEGFKLWFEEPYRSFVTWTGCYDIDTPEDNAPVHVELTTYDASGNVLDTVQWKVP